MISLEIFKLDCDDNPISTLNIGEHVFGRGDLLECDDRRVSRNHGLITVTADAACITSIHQNPCFYIFQNSKTITILPKGSPVNISDGDKFALLADKFWFKIKIKNVDNASNVAEESGLETEGNITEALKRQCQDKSYNNSNKKLKPHTAINANFNELSQNSTNEMVRAEQQTEVKLSNTESSELMNSEPDQNGASIQEGLCGNTCVSKNPDEIASTSINQRQMRDYCLYGTQCYRRNLAHLAEFSHPGDSDYESDPNDQRPICNYGTTCYRKNKNHRSTYKHPRNVKNLENSVRNRAKKRNTKKTYIDELSEDEYDMDDPFMADSGSEFEVDGDLNESESESSDEEDEEFNRLLNEAKTFTRSRKKN